MTYTREEIQLLAAYEADQIAIRQQLVSGIYHNAVNMLAKWQAFEAKFAQPTTTTDPETGETVEVPGGEFADLAAQYVADSAEQVSAEEIQTMAGALAVIVQTIQAIAARNAEMFPGVTVEVSE